MKTMDIKVYGHGRYHKHPYVPDYLVDTNQPFVLIRNVPIFFVTAEQVDAVVLNRYSCIASASSSS